MPLVAIVSCVAIAVAEPATTTTTASRPTTTATAPATTRVVDVNLGDLGEPFDGWGTSLAWWAHRVGGWPDATLDRMVDDLVDPRHGLGLTVFRYNVGGGDDPSHHHLRPGGDVPGFRASATAPYDWTADANQRRVLLKLIAATTRTAAATRPILEAFSNAPPYWMTISGCISGAADGGPNLRERDESAFADYLADVVRFYRDAHGITFDSLEPTNEPDGFWWKAMGKQEGMNVPADQQARLIRLCRAALDARGLRKTIVSANDDNSLDRAVDDVARYDAATLAALGRINSHSYSGTRRDALRELAARLDKPLWQSETGPIDLQGTDFEQEVAIAGRVIVDLNRMQPRVWCMWQAPTARGGARSPRSATATSATARSTRSRSSPARFAPAIAWSAPTPTTCSRA